MKRNLFLTVILMAITFSVLNAQSNSATLSSEPPMIPVGTDAYLMWDKLPYQRIGVRSYMRSTYDRQGNNRSSDASHFLYQESDSFNVALDVKGSGILYFMRTNHFHGSPWHYEIDNKDFIVKETSTDDPIDAKKRYKNVTFIPEELFPRPLTETWSVTKGSDLMWVPLSFENSLRIAYSRTFYATGYYIYHTFSPGIKHISKPITSWEKTPPDPKVIELINKSGTDIAPKGEGINKNTGEISLTPFELKTIVQISGKPQMIRTIKFSIPREKAFDFGKCRLRITWDNKWHASIDAPIDLFFGTGSIYNNNDREFLVKGFPMSIRYDNDSVYLACYWPMPFFENAKIEIEEKSGKSFQDIKWEIRTEPYTDPKNHVAYFHATYTDHPEPVIGQDNVFLDTRDVEGGGLWSGHVVGMSWIFSRNGVLTTLEGDPRFFFDDAKSPQAWATGTEEWGGGGDYWGGENMTIPFAGHPVGKNSKNKEEIKNEKDLVNSAYRFLIADYFPFGRRAVIGIEHGGTNASKEHYSGVVYWYGVNSPSLITTDFVNVCDTASIRIHNIKSPDANEPYALVSRYELGPDKWVPEWSSTDEEEYEKSMDYYYPGQDYVRTTKGATEFTISLEPENLGVLLRRKLDYLYPNQNAKIFIKANGQDTWNYVGEWYTAGSNTCVHSRPQGWSFTEAELGQTQHNVFESNRRWREDEFLLPRELTEGIEKLDVKIEFIKNEKDLYPGYPFPAESAWSESKYWVYCYKMPDF